MKNHSLSLSALKKIIKAELKERFPRIWAYEAGNNRLLVVNGHFLKLVAAGELADCLTASEMATLIDDKRDRPNISEVIPSGPWEKVAPSGFLSDFGVLSRLFISDNGEFCGVQEKYYELFNNLCSLTYWSIGGPDDPYSPIVATNDGYFVGLIAPIRGAGKGIQRAA